MLASPERGIDVLSRHGAFPGTRLLFGSPHLPSFSMKIDGLTTQIPLEIRANRDLESQVRTILADYGSAIVVRMLLERGVIPDMADLLDDVVDRLYTDIFPVSIFEAAGRD